MIDQIEPPRLPALSGISGAVKPKPVFKKIRKVGLPASSPSEAASTDEADKLRYRIKAAIVRKSLTVDRFTVITGYTVMPRESIFDAAVKNGLASDFRGAVDAMGEVAGVAEDIVDWALDYCINEPKFTSTMER